MANKKSKKSSKKKYSAKKSKKYSIPNPQPPGPIIEHIPPIISIETIIKSIDIFPNQYPSKQFLQDHYEIIKPYITYINIYKGTCYKTINNYYRTGEIILQNCGGISLDGKNTIDSIKLVIEKMEELYDKVKPLDHDIIVYRGIYNGMIGQNLFDGNCIQTDKYSLDEHGFCDKGEIVPISLFKDYDGTRAARYVYESLGWASVSTSINISFQFSNEDTILMLRMPAGTKFIMPLIHGTGFPDNEYEFILFPGDNTFILYDKLPSKHYGDIHVGGFCNSLNKFKTGKTKYRPFKIKFGSSYDWSNDINNNDPVLGVALNSNLGKNCGAASCHSYFHFCDPETGKCIGDTKANRDKMKKLIADANTLGKCTPEKVNECIDDNKLCLPQTGECDAIESYSNKKFFDYTDPKKIASEQKPRYACDQEAIDICSEIGELCNPLKPGECMPYSQDNVWIANNRLSNEELAKLSPRGVCTQEKIEKFAKNGLLCHPHYGYGMKYDKYGWDIFEKSKGKVKEPKKRKSRKSKENINMDEIIKEMQDYVTSVQYNEPNIKYKLGKYKINILKELAKKVEISNKGKKFQLVDNLTKYFVDNNNSNINENIIDKTISKLWSKQYTINDTPELQLLLSKLKKSDLIEIPHRISSPPSDIDKKSKSYIINYIIEYVIKEGVF